MKFSQAPKHVKPLACFLIIFFVVNIGGLILMKRHINNLVIYHFFTPVEYCFYSIIFYRYFGDKKIKSAILFSIIIFTVFCFLNTFFLQSLDINNSNAIIGESILIITWCLFFFREKISEPDNIDPKNEPLFWIATGVLFYFLGNVFIEGLLNYLIKKEIAIARTLYKISYIFSYILFCFICIVFYIVGNKKSNNLKSNGSNF